PGEKRIVALSAIPARCGQERKSSGSTWDSGGGAGAPRPPHPGRTGSDRRDTCRSRRRLRASCHGHDERGRVVVRRPIAVVAAGAAVGVAFDVLAWGKAPGLSFPLLVAALVALVLGVARAQGVTP